MRFEGRTVVITGAGSGIGAAATDQFVAEGARVFGADLHPATVPAPATGIACDVSSPEDVERAIGTAVSETGRLDVMVNNAGIGSTSDAATCTPDEWDRVFAVNARGVFLGTKYALAPMLSAGRGAIVNTASVAGLVGLHDRAAYCASKGAVVSFTKQVALQYARAGIRCNCVCPGTVDSPWVEGLLTDAEDPAAARAALIARQPMGRLGTPDEIARAIVYLASDDASFVTGAAWVIDGGLVAG